MLIKGPVFKLILGGLFTLGLSAAAAGVIYWAFVKPVAPTNLYVTISHIGGTTLEDCQPVVNFRDISRNEDELRVYRRNLGASAFTLIRIFPSSPGWGDSIVYIDKPLPLGTYEYEVSSYNKMGESFSYSVPITVVYSTCIKVPTIDPSTLPINPIIVSLSIINDCNVRISYRDNSTNEQGIKIIRWTILPAPSGLTIVATLGPHAGILGTYDDKTKLPAGTYGYSINIFNQKGGADSNEKEIEVTSVCNPAVKSLPTKIPAPLALPTAQKLSTESCTWQAAANVFLRKGPNVGVYDRLIDEKSGATLPIVGQSEDGQFWAVEVSSGVIGYITKAEIYSRTSGDCSSVPTLKDPPPPVIKVVPTKKPSDNNNNGDPVISTPCPVGAVCP